MEYVRWLIKRDVQACLSIPSMNAWDREELIFNLRQRNCIGMVYEDLDEIVGWFAYTLHADHLHISNIAANDWDSDVCRSMIQNLVNKLSHQRRNLITVACPDDQDDVLVLLRECGFVVWCQGARLIQLRYELPLKIQTCVIGGVTCRRSTGLKCLVPEGV